MAAQGTPNFDTRLIFVIGLCSSLLFVTIMFAIWAGFEYVWNAETYTKQVEPDYQPLIRHVEAQEAQIDGSAEGTLAIGEAMKRIAEEN